jgi:hypothetical protein
VFCLAQLQNSRNRLETGIGKLCILRRRTVFHLGNTTLVVSREIIPNAQKVMPEQKSDQREKAR